MMKVTHFNSEYFVLAYKVNLVLFSKVQYPNFMDYEKYYSLLMRLCIFNPMGGQVSFLLITSMYHGLTFATLVMFKFKFSMMNKIFSSLMGNETFKIVDATVKCYYR